MLVEKREQSDAIEILHNDMTCERAEPKTPTPSLALRKTITKDMVKEAAQGLTERDDDAEELEPPLQHNRDKMKTGDIFELAEVVRNLSLSDRKRVFHGRETDVRQGKKILISELMYAKGMDEEETAEWLDEVLSRPRTRRSARQGRRGRVGAPPMCVWAVIAAAGSGERLGWTGRGVREPATGARCWPRAWSGSRRSDWIDSIVVAAPPDWEEPVILLAEELGCGKVVEAVPGGETRGGLGRAPVSPTCLTTPPSCSSTMRRGRCCPRRSSSAC